MELNSDELVAALRTDLREKIRLEQARLETEQQRQADIKRIADGHRRLHDLADKFERGLELLATYQQIDDIIRDLTVEIPRQLDRIEKLLFIILVQPGGKPKSSRTGELESSVIEEHIKSLRNQIGQYRRDLDRVQQQKAKFGMSTPLHLINEIEMIKGELKKLYVELRFFEGIQND